MGKRNCCHQEYSHSSCHPSRCQLTDVAFAARKPIRRANYLGWRLPIQDILTSGMKMVDCFDSIIFCTTGDAPRNLLLGVGICWRPRSRSNRLGGPVKSVYKSVGNFRFWGTNQSIHIGVWAVGSYLSASCPDCALFLRCFLYWLVFQKRIEDIYWQQYCEPHEHESRTTGSFFLQLWWLEFEKTDKGLQRLFPQNGPAHATAKGRLCFRHHRTDPGFVSGHSAAWRHVDSIVIIDGLRLDYSGSFGEGSNDSVAFVAYWLLSMFRIAQKSL